MAISLTLVAATPHSLKYRWNYDGAGGVGSGIALRTQAALIADFAGVSGPSPLKALLVGVPSDGAWGTLDETPELSLSTNVTALLAGTGVTSNLEVVVGPGRVLRVIGIDGNGGEAIIEMRFHHTIDR